MNFQFVHLNYFYLNLFEALSKRAMVNWDFNSMETSENVKVSSLA